MWRVVRNLLPIVVNLWKKKVSQSPYRQRYRKTEETIFHALIESKVSQNIRRLTPYREEIKVSESKDVLSFVLEIARKKSKFDLEMMIALCLVSWHSRILLIFNNKKEDR